MRRSFTLLALAVIVAGIALTAFLGRHDDDGFSFAARAGRFLITGPAVARLHAAGVVVAGGRHGADVIGQQAAAVPPGKTTQIMKFRFRSRGFFGAAPKARFTVGLAGSWRQSQAPARNAEDGFVGRGVIIGSTPDAAHGCGAAPRVQVAAFRHGGVTQFDTTCSAVLKDDTWYGLTLTASLDGTVTYVLVDADNKVIGAGQIHDHDANQQERLGGWWLSHVGSGNPAGRDFRFDIADFETAWLTGAATGQP